MSEAYLAVIVLVVVFCLPQSISSSHSDEITKILLQEAEKSGILEPEDIDRPRTSAGGGGLPAFSRYSREPQHNFLRFGRAPEHSFIRFGRSKGASVPNVDETEKDSSRKIRAGVTGHNFMRFGRNPEHQFIRFGRPDHQFIRFGRPDHQFMRFGRSGSTSSEEESDIEELPLNTDDLIALLQAVEPEEEVKNKQKVAKPQ